MQLDEMVWPADIDLHLPHDKYFSWESFIETLQNHHLEVSKSDVHRDPWRYTIIVDKVMMIKLGVFFFSPQNSISLEPFHWSLYY